MDGRQLRLRRISRPERAQAELLEALNLELPERVGQDVLDA